MLIVTEENEIINADKVWIIRIKECDEEEYSLVAETVCESANIGCQLGVYDTLENAMRAQEAIIMTAKEDYGLVDLRKRS